MDPDLDGLLSGAAPTVATRTDGLRRELDALVADAEAAASSRRPRTSRILGLTGLAVAAVIGVGVATGASGEVDTPWSAIVSKKFTYPGPSIHADELQYGRNCRVVFGADSGWDPLHPVSDDDRYAARTHAKQFVKDFDLSTISVPDAIDRYLTLHAEMVASMGPPDQPPAQSRPEGPPDEIRMTAVMVEIDRRLQADLAANGLSTHAVSATAMPECEENFPPGEDRP